MSVKLPSKIGKGNSLFYALIVAVFLTWNTIDWHYDKKQGWVFGSKDPPIEIVMPCFIFIGVGLGINLSGAFQAIAQVSQSLANIATIVTRNSVAISNIAAKTGTELPPEDNTQSLEADDTK